MTPLPSPFCQRIREAFGVEGDRWLMKLPDICEGLLLDWKLILVIDYFELSYNFVRRVFFEDGTPAILKIGMPEHGHLREVASLTHFNGRSSVRILKTAPSSHAYLMEDLSPGTELKTLFDSGQDEKAMQICAKVIKDLQTGPSPSSTGPCKPIAELMSDFETYLSRPDLNGISDEQVREAQSLFANLLETSPKQIILHGDLHHQNILKSENRGWTAIDPKGFVGDPCFEVGAFIRNPMPDLAEHPLLDSILKKRITFFSRELEFPVSRIAEWSYVQAILATIWFSLDHGKEDQGWHKIARALRKLSLEL